MIDVNNLRIYKLSREVSRDILDRAKIFPKEERYGLTSQMKRAVISIGANIAEGTGRSTIKDCLRFLYIALGSLKETLHYVEISREADFISEKIFLELKGKLEKLRKMIISFIKNSSPLLQSP